jgi:hypothetical protein
LKRHSKKLAKIVGFARDSFLRGDAAKLLGDAARSSVAFWRPGLDHKLLDKANRAILKGGDTKEVRISLGRWAFRAE